MNPTLMSLRILPSGTTTKTPSRYFPMSSVGLLHVAPYDSVDGSTEIPVEPVPPKGKVIANGPVTQKPSAATAQIRTCGLSVASNVPENGAAFAASGGRK